MLRYLLLSAFIVFGIAIVVAGWMNRDLIRIKIASVYAKVSPKPVPANPAESVSPAPLRGDAPWALSALPECLVQLSETSGPPAFVMSHLPAGAVQIAPPATLHYADCTISLAGDEAYVVRGPDRLRIPPKVWLYRSATSLAMVRRDARGTELRVYQPAPTR
ncbi:MAG: hypothetical protein JO192_08490 [Candidatus Eremiobacteraeota bacterium]|nr:hypothetical protein [Candidatus Eremiobacteraeota bacterium]MBV8721797.1 hypothetical protein [Candidatus Eremiobacteraeota bacterium]